MTTSQDLSHLCCEHIPFEGLPQRICAEELFLRRKGVIEPIPFFMKIPENVSVLKQDLTLEIGSRRLSLEFYQDQSSNRIYGLALDFYLRGEGRLHLSNNEIRVFCFFFEVFVVLLHSVGIRGAKGLKADDIFRANPYLNVVGGREEGEVKGFEHILFDVSLVDCTEVVEPTNFLEALANLGPEICGDPHYRQRNPFFGSRLN